MTSKIPKIALSNKLEFNVIAPCIEQLNDVEERMCSPRIAFIRIRPLAWDAQKGNKTRFLINMFFTNINPIFSFQASLAM